MANARILFWDIETTNLSANYGFLLSAAWKAQGDKKVTCLDITQFGSFKKRPTDDKLLVKAVRDALIEADIWVTHYGPRFDIPYLNTRLIHHGLDPMPKIPCIDTWRICKYELKLNSNRLAVASEFLECGEKTPVKGNAWVEAMAGDKKAIKYVVDHNIKDVIVLENLYEKIKNLCRTHPNVNLVSGATDSCPTCGGRNSLQRRGFTIAQTSRKQRYQCNRCGAWSHGKPDRLKGVFIR